VNNKRARIQTLSGGFRDGETDARYLAFFDCFNRGGYFEAHEVLEDLWLGERGQPNDRFYKGLIQLAGAFVHLQKDRLHPAAALFRLAAANLATYPAIHERLGVAALVTEIGGWINTLENSGFARNPLAAQPALRLGLEPG
jgi:predicted metal-dependent hydrolase